MDRQEHIEEAAEIIRMYRKEGMTWNEIESYKGIQRISEAMLVLDPQYLLLWYADDLDRLGYANAVDFSEFSNIIEILQEGQRYYFETEIIEEAIELVKEEEELTEEEE